MGGGGGGGSQPCAIGCLSYRIHIWMGKNEKEKESKNKTKQKKTGGEGQQIIKPL